MRMRKWALFLGLGSLLSVATFFLVVALISVVGQTIVRRVAERMSVDAHAFADVMRQAVSVTLAEGDSFQKVELINQLAGLGPAAREFIPDLVQCAASEDPQVREAAVQALRAIDPQSIDQPQLM